MAWRPRRAWLALTAGLGVEGRRALEAYEQIAGHYGEPQRAYHTLQHVGYVLQTAQQLASAENSLAPIQLAAWLHDVVYDPRAPDNEARSASFAADLLQRLGQPPALIGEVQRLILLTGGHQTSPEDVDGAVLLDADLAVLAARPVEYALYAAAIRHEYDWVDEQAYRAGRIAVLQRFLQRPFIYHTPPMRHGPEQKARHNLRAEIARLS